MRSVLLRSSTPAAEGRMRAAAGMYHLSSSWCGSTQVVVHLRPGARLRLVARGLVLDQDQKEWEGRGRRKVESSTAHGNEKKAVGRERRRRMGCGRGTDGVSIRGSMTRSNEQEREARRVNGGRKDGARQNFLQCRVSRATPSCAAFSRASLPRRPARWRRSRRIGVHLGLFMYGERDPRHVAPAGNSPYSRPSPYGEEERDTRRAGWGDRGREALRVERRSPSNRARRPGRRVRERRARKTAGEAEAEAEDEAPGAGGAGTTLGYSLFEGPADGVVTPAGSVGKVGQAECVPRAKRGAAAGDGEDVGVLGVLWSRNGNCSNVDAARSASRLLMGKGGASRPPSPTPTPRRHHQVARAASECARRHPSPPQARFRWISEVSRQCPRPCGAAPKQRLPSNWLTSGLGWRKPAHETRAGRGGIGGALEFIWRAWGILTEWQRCDAREKPATEGGRGPRGCYKLQSPYDAGYRLERQRRVPGVSDVFQRASPASSQAETCYARSGCVRVGALASRVLRPFVHARAEITRGPPRTRLCRYARRCRPASRATRVWTVCETASECRGCAARSVRWTRGAVRAASACPRDAARIGLRLRVSPRTARSCRVPTGARASELHATPAERGSPLAFPSQDPEHFERGRRQKRGGAHGTRADTRRGNAACACAARDAGLTGILPIKKNQRENGWGLPCAHLASCVLVFRVDASVGARRGRSRGSRPCTSLGVDERRRGNGAGGRERVRWIGRYMKRNEKRAGPTSLMKEQVSDEERSGIQMYVPRSCVAALKVWTRERRGRMGVGERRGHRKHDGVILCAWIGSRGNSLSQEDSCKSHTG
ncbi:hypothetical protein B0H17DRAFT_1147210 [Mycena rosella]|uniref:Uncharacterized protein n=1 Tax=Mycena rosella TaxID=1033263 RepID=A0AAD7CM32_MYCRO|nr:hypothetical protein B0H17DRAFT_1147210 [Mycena rosella]